MGKEKVIFRQPRKAVPAGRQGKKGGETSSERSPPLQAKGSPRKRPSTKQKTSDPPVPISPKSLTYKEKSFNAGVRKGEEKYVEDEIKKSHESQQKLEALVTKTSKPLLKVRAVWPFDFFPDEIIVDTEKVDIVSRTFFWSKQVKCVMLKNIFDVIVETSLLFATIRIIDKNYVEQESSIGFLWKNEAMRAKNIIQGLVTAVAEGIDLTKCDKNDLVEKMKKIGKTGTS